MSVVLRVRWMPSKTEEGVRGSVQKHILGTSGWRLHDHKVSTPHQHSIIAQEDDDILSRKVAYSHGRCAAYHVLGSSMVS